ncbi:hypothetical protein [Desulfobacter curvatus]|uniref:hypothetical protein n=1 Tax=Desulfobacter curvatus TaxID=2290 RepID=UPI00036F9ADA|nr:hypothetical protein [Desulfobacter curvatus]
MCGWSQGHFIIEDDGTGTDQVMTAQSQPVTTLTFDTDPEETESRDQTEGKKL